MSSKCLEIVLPCIIIQVKVKVLRDCESVKRLFCQVLSFRLDLSLTDESCRRCGISWQTNRGPQLFRAWCRMLLMFHENEKETELWAELCAKQPLLRNRQKIETKHTFLSPSSGFESGVFESKFWDEVLSSKLNWIGQHWRPSSRSWRRSAKSNFFIFCCHLLHEIHIESKYDRGSINFPYMPPNTVVRGKGKPRRSLQKKVS